MTAPPGAEDERRGRGGRRRPGAAVASVVLAVVFVVGFLILSTAVVVRTRVLDADVYTDAMVRTEAYDRVYTSRRPAVAPPAHAAPGRPRRGGDRDRRRRDPAGRVVRGHRGAPGLRHRHRPGDVGPPLRPALPDRRRHRRRGRHPHRPRAPPGPGPAGHGPRPRRLRPRHRTVPPPRGCAGHGACPGAPAGGQDAIPPDETADAFAAAGLGPYLHEHEPVTPWATLGDLIDRGERLVVFAEEAGPPPAWYHQAFENMQDTPFGFASPGEMSCGPNRGDPDAPLFLMNHWVSRLTPDRATAAEVNTRHALVDRARRCGRERGLRPNYLAVDFYGIGDVTGAADVLNGLD